MFSPRGTTPVCNSSCKGCYLFANYKGGQDSLASTEVPEVVKLLREQGIDKFYPITTELLLAPNWREILQATWDKYVNTNGIVIAKRKETILLELAEAGIEQIVITANISPYHDDVSLTQKTFVDLAFLEIARFNQNATKPFKTVATVIVTSTNFDKIAEMCSYVKEVYKADSVKFIAFIPLEADSDSLSPSLEQLSFVVSEIERMRRLYDKDKFYIQRGGTLGTIGLSKSKIDAVCPAGEDLLGIKSLQDGSQVTPCIYLPDTIVGSVVHGKIVLDIGLHAAFLDTKRKALDAGYCPAHAKANGIV